MFKPTLWVKVYKPRFINGEPVCHVDVTLIGKIGQKLSLTGVAAVDAINQQGPFWVSDFLRYIDEQLRTFGLRNLRLDV